MYTFLEATEPFPGRHLSFRAKHSLHTVPYFTYHAICTELTIAVSAVTVIHLSRCPVCFHLHFALFRISIQRGAMVWKTEFSQFDFRRSG